MSSDLGKFVLGGYFILKYSDKGFAPSSLMPKRVISLSRCISDRLQIHWGWEVERYRHEAIEFGIAEERLAALHDWSLKADAESDGNYALDDAREAIQTLLPSNTDVLLIGAGLHHELVDDFLTFKPYPDVHPNYEVYQSPDHDNFAKNQLKNHIVNERKPLEPGGEPLGFEVISWYHGWGHSWLCGGLEADMNKRFGIRPNRYGLITTYQEARQVYDWIAEDKMQGERAEPEPHYPWLIVRYPLDG